ncbi:MAG: hypothetical protein K8S25_01675 [Alphaproteobacteria bacterium]|nr:hypothetical protein [Alphaproteobacteria bacterium]
MSTPMDPVVVDILKAFIGPVTAVGLAWLVGHRISATWALRQRRREQSLATVAEFYRLYGDFFALWKLCNYAFRDSKHEIEEATLWDLMRRATALEASGETILLRISSELTLTEDDIRTLGLFRQGVQMLRLSIVKRRILGWISSQHPDYLAFKSLSVAVAKLASQVGSKDPPAKGVAQEQLRAVTHNKWNKEWAANAAKPAPQSDQADEEE